MLLRGIAPMRTARLTIRRVRRDDRDQFLATIDDEVRRWQGYDDNVVAVFERRFRRRDVWRGSLLGMLVVCDGDGTVVGEYSLGPPRSEGSPMTLGWWLGPTARGRGYGRESLEAVLATLHAIGFLAIEIGTSLDNVRARRQIEAVGAVLVEDDLAHLLPNGTTVRGRWYRHDHPLVGTLSPP